MTAKSAMCKNVFLLQPVYLDVMNESYMHNVPKGKLYFHC